MPLLRVRAITEALPNWLLSPHSARDVLKIAGVALSSAAVIYGSVLMIYRFQEGLHEFNAFTHSYEVMARCRDQLDLSGKVVIVTGSNTGIGKETAKQLYAAGCIVVVACRNRDKATVAIQDIANECSDRDPKHLIFIPLDLGDLKTIDSFVTEFNQNALISGKLHFLVNNAGILATKYGVTKNGISRSFGVNYVGHFYLVNKLIDVIKQNKTRIINLTSVTHRWTNMAEMNRFITHKVERPIGPTPDVVPYRDSQAGYYPISKMCNVLFTRRLNRLYHKHGVVALAVHPGSIKTQILNGWFSEHYWLLTALWTLYSGFTKSVSQGAATTLRAVTITNEEIFHGDWEDVDNMMLYFVDGRCKNEEMHPEIQNNNHTEMDAALWEYTKKVLTNVDYVKLNEL